MMMTWWHDDMMTWWPDDLMTWRHDHLMTWSHDHMITWSHDPMTTWRLDDMSTRRHDDSKTWQHDIFKSFFTQGRTHPFTHSGTQSGGHTHPRTHPHTHPWTHPHTHLQTYPYTHPHGGTWSNGETLTLTYPFTCWHTLDNKPYLCARIVRFTEPKCYNLKVQWEVRSHSAPIRRTLLKLRFCAKSQEFHDGMTASLCRVQARNARSTYLMPEAPISCPKHLRLWASEYMSKGMSMSLRVNAHRGRHTRSPTHWYPHWVDVHSVTL